MSNLPEIDHLKVSKRAVSKTSEAITPQLLDAILQVAQLEVLAEALRDERDAYKGELDAVSAERDHLLATRTEPKQESSE